MERAPDERARDGVGAAADPAVERFLAGDAETAAELLGAIRGTVGSRGFYVPVDDRPEIVSETMIHLLQHLANPKHARPRSLVALARTMAYRRCVDWMRRHVPTGELPDGLDAGASQERTVLAVERATLGAKALSQISEACRELIHRHSCEGETFREIAERDGKLEKTVRNQLYKCLDRARIVLRRLQRRDRLAPRGT